MASSGDPLDLVGKTVGAYQAVVHRDLKPANVMLDRDNRVLRTDFGISGADACSPCL